MEGMVLTNGKFAASGRISAAGYPLSVSDTFQQRNLGRTVAESWTEVEHIAAKASTARVDLVVYLSMAFGNPYGDAHSPELVVDFARRLAALGVTTISLADTIGSATPALISELFRTCAAACPGVTFTCHLHSTPDAAPAKLDAALDAGCRLFDSALAGIGGCPFASDHLTGNIDTMLLLRHLEARGYPATLDHRKLAAASDLAARYAARYGGN
jgi:hydroxymethylglutaryl-CoA lyase